MLLYLIRHGDPIYETDSLTDRGKLQAEAVGKRMFDANIGRIYSSPMGRAMETADPACRLLGLEKNIEQWTHEIEDERLTPFPDGKMKSITLVQNTYYLENGIYRILRPNDDKVALFCHAAFSRAWLSVLLHIPLHIMWASFQYTHTGVTVVEFENNANGFTAPRCLCYSDVSHLYASKLDLIHDNRVEI